MDNKTNRFAVGTFWEMIKHFISSRSSDNDPKGSKDNWPELIRLVIAMIGLIAFLLFLCFAEGVKIVFRQNIGKDRIDLFRIVLCSLGVLALAVASFVFAFRPDDFIPNTGSPDSYFATGLILTFLGVYVLIKGIRNWVWAKNNNPTSYRGDSFFLNYLLRKNWPLRKIQTIAEPLIMMNLSILFSFFNLFGGLVFFVCGLSLWCSELEEFIVKRMNIQQRAASLYNKANPNSGFTTLNSD